jgi:hypothetical protein
MKEHSEPLQEPGLLEIALSFEKQGFKNFILIGIKDTTPDEEEMNLSYQLIHNVGNDKVVRYHLEETLNNFEDFSS